jgi:signal transduction histidine kinase
VNSRLKNELVEILRILRGRKRQRLVRHYFFYWVMIISAGLITSGLLEVYFNYRQSWNHFALIQKEIATSTGFKIEAFVQEIERTMKAATRTREVVREGLAGEFRWELRRLLVNVPAIMETVAFDLNGAKSAEAQRLRRTVDYEKWVSEHPAILETTRQGKSYFGPVNFFEGTGPYMNVAVPIERFAGNIIGFLCAAIDLKHVGQVVSNVRVGKAGYAYLLTDGGSLIGHRDLSLVLQKRKIERTERASIALGTDFDRTKPNAFVTRNIEGDKVFTSYAPISSLGWTVFVEQPIAEIYAPLYATMLRTTGSFMVALGVALVATLLVRRRVVGPLETLRQGVERIGRGDLTARLDLKTGDEIEILAEEFNDMAAHLREAYAELERKVAERTEALTIANDKLADASQQKSHFLANVNHELRTPLSSIIGYARLLRRGSEGQLSPLQQENLADLLRNAERLLGLIDSLLDFAKIEAGKMDAHIEPVKVEELIQTVVTIIEPMLDRNSIRLVRDVPPSMAPLLTDPEKLRQILLNLLGNAVKFTGAGEIRISACQENGHFKLAVADTGIGIDKADLGRIFEEFDRGRLTAAGSYRGTGLGLAIVKRLVDFLGGTVTVESELGRGSIFTVTLPSNKLDLASV